ncbi:MAG: SDR family NAD(P)-dependent oxidoreductase [Halieaceae bacterium]|nr:SDR family NAD(P)-dependent oxidoreductase [Halieaceae bacterium]
MKKKWSTIYISGGGSGIGLYFAKKFAAEGVKVAIFDIRISDQVRKELFQVADAAALDLHELDICDSSAVSEAAQQSAVKLGGPELAINCAGVQISKPFLDLSEGEFARVININLIGSRNFAAAVLPHMGRGSRLAFVASLAGLISTYSYAAYNASKFGVVGLAGAVRMDSIARGIEVSVICPPEVMTPMVEEELRSMDPITFELKQVAGTLDLNSACDEILTGLEKGKFYIIPGFRARMIWRLNRWFPGLVLKKADKIILGGTSEGKL